MGLFYFGPTESESTRQVAVGRSPLWPWYWAEPVPRTVGAPTLRRCVNTGGLRGGARYVFSVVVGSNIPETVPEISDHYVLILPRLYTLISPLLSELKCSKGSGYWGCVGRAKAKVLCRKLNFYQVIDHYEVSTFLKVP